MGCGFDAPQPGLEVMRPRRLVPPSASEVERRAETTGPAADASARRRKRTGTVGRNPPSARDGNRWRSDRTCRPAREPTQRTGYRGPEDPGAYS